MAAEDSYGFDTEFHTERTYVPDLALIQIAWATRWRWSTRSPSTPPPWPAVFGGPGVAVAHAASQDLDVLHGGLRRRSRHRLRHPDRRRLPRPVHARRSPGWSTRCSASRLPKADRLSDWLVRPISERQITYAVNDVAHLLELARRAHRAAPGARAPGVGPRASATQVLGDRTPARVPEEAWWKLGDIRGMSRRSRAVAQEVAAWRERTAAETNRPRRMVLSDLGLLALSQRPPAQRRRAAAPPAASTGATWPRAGRPRSCGRSSGASSSRRTRSGCPRKGATRPRPPAAVAVCSGLVRQIADDLDFDQGLLATRADIAQLLCGEPSRLDTGWRRTIVGDPLRRLIAGEVGRRLRRARSPRHGGALREGPLPPDR